jgi:small conductance mechanosensitive channel
MTDSVSVIYTSLAQVWFQMLMFVPKVIVAIFIWVIGKYLINLAVNLIRRIDIKGTKIDDYLVRIFSGTVLVLGKILLVLVILDYLGVGRTILGAIANGLTLTVAIALGLAFGKALEDDAKDVIREFKRHLVKKSG